jgi:tripartite-type tricarboxylate transporter receptor subunit TctC
MSRTVTATLIGLMGLTLAAAGSTCAQAQAKYPTKPIELIVPFVAGAASDATARIMAQFLEARWSVPVKVVNKPGGNTVPAVTEVMSARPDGTMLLLDSNPSSAMLDTVVKNLPFKVADRTFVGVMAYTPMMFIVHADSPIRNLKEAGEAMRTQGETFTWTSLGGAGAQDMTFRRFAVAAGFDIGKTRPIALKGGAEAVTLTAGGHVNMGVGTWAAIAAPMSAGKLRVLAVAAEERWPELDVPTTGEAGFANVEVTLWFGLSGPPRLPAEIVATWDAALQDAANDKAVREKLLKVGVVASHQGARDMAARIERESQEIRTLFGR